MIIRRLLIAMVAVLLASSALGAPKKEVSVWVSRNVAPSNKIRMNINTKNVPTVHIAAYKIDGAKWLRGIWRDQSRPGFTGRAAKEWQQTVAQPNQRPNRFQADAYYSRQVNLPLLNPGVYLISVTGGEKEAWAVVNVTHLAVVAKRSPKRMLVWVTNALTGSLVPGAGVVAYAHNGNRVASATTGRDGAALFPINPGEETLVVSRGNDMAGIPTVAEDQDGKLRAHFQTDRPIYRPGQTVFFKTILRRTFGQGYRPVANELCTVRLRDPKDNPIDELTIASNSMGSVAGQFEIPSEGMVGPYTLVLKIGKDTAYQTITVAEYRKPEYKVGVKPAEKRYLAGQDITFQVDAQYYFGAPVPQALVRYTVRRSPMYFWDSDPNERYFYGGDGNLYPRDTYGGNPFVAEDKAYTDKDGKVSITVHTDKDQPDSTYIFSCTVEDASRRQVQSSGSVPVYAAAIRLGLRTKIVYASLGSLIPFEVRAVDLDGKPTAAKVTLILTEPEWIEKEGRWKDKELTRTQVAVPASGKANATLPAKSEGSLTITAIADDGTGRKARATMEVYVVGPFEKTVKEKPEPQLGMMLDRRTYAPGDTVKAYVTTNKPGLPILEVLEGQDIFEYRVIRSGVRGQTWDIKTGPEMSPNAYVTAVQWFKGQMMSSNALIPLPDPTRTLTVKATPDKTTYRPGDKATYTIQTFDSKGRPVAAEVSLAVVDEAIYALSPDVTSDIYGLYWGLRQNLVAMTVSAPEELSGGAYQRVNTTVAPVRQRFEDTAFWNAFVATGADGTAKVTFEMPGNLTSWRATARGITSATSVGMAVGNVQANRPVMLRLATPRQMVQGDVVTVIGTIDNRSESEHDFEASLVAEGVTLEGGDTKTVRVPAKSQVKVEWILNAPKLPDSGKAILTGQVVAKDAAQDPDYADALKVSVPVVPNGVQQRVVTGGTVAREATVNLDLPADRIEPASIVRVEVNAGLRPVMLSAADRIMRTERYGSAGAANQLVVAAMTGVPSNAKQIREIFALLSRTQMPGGWGWWENSPTDDVITAKVAYALGLARASKITVWENLTKAAQADVIERYNRTNLWEHRALLAAAATFVGAKEGLDRIEEVRTRGQNLSPFARLRLAEALAGAGKKDEAMELVQDVLKDASDGPTEAFIPAGYGVGWTASETETTAQALTTLLRLGAEPALQAKLARWLVNPTSRYWRSDDEETAIVRALALYTQEHPDASKLGDVRIEIGGKTVAATPAKFGNSASVLIPRDLLKDGANPFVVRRTGDGEAFYSVEARIFEPSAGESTHGIRVLRRFEVRNDAGVWVELNREVHPAEPVRCTVVVWGDDVSDALKVVEPLPAGFEMAESEYFAYGREEVRDGAIIHYILNQGAPQTFRYYLRAEAEGRLVTLPATGEYLRRPATRGESSQEKIQVKAAKG